MGDQDEVLGRLRQQARQLVAELPGPLRRVRLSSGEATVEVEWPDSGAPTVTDSAVAGHNGDTGRAAGTAADDAPLTAQPAPFGAHPPQEAGGDGSGPRIAGSGPPPGGRDIVAPIVGTFYRAPEPGAEPYVRVGDLVEAGQVVGIVEAMKLMNQVFADAAGRVTAVLAGDGEPVQFGQSLIRLTTA